MSVIWRRTELAQTCRHVAVWPEARPGGRVSMACSASRYGNHSGSPGEGYCATLLNIGSGRAKVQFAVGFRFQGKTGHVVVDADDALIAALKVKIQRPEALIAYVRQQNKRGDTRHPMRRLSNESP